MRGECCHLLRSICNKKIIFSLFCNGANKQANVFKKVFDEARLLRTLKITNKTNKTIIDCGFHMIMKN